MIKEFTGNPRTITEKQFGDLKRWLKEYGDLSGVVHNIEDDEIISGNQRCKALDVNSCKIELVKEYKEPDKQGTVALGFIIWEGNRYNYRRVKWPREIALQANLIANKAGGDWDWDILANLFEPEVLLECGFEEWEIRSYDDNEEECKDQSENEKESSETVISVGEFKISISSRQYEAWKKNILEQNDYEDDNVKASIIKMLGL